MNPKRNPGKCREREHRETDQCPDPQAKFLAALADESAKLRPLSLPTALLAMRVIQPAGHLRALLLNNLQLRPNASQFVGQLRAPRGIGLEIVHVSSVPLPRSRADVKVP